MKKHGCLWWLFIGWWWRPITLPFWLLARLIKLGRRAAATPQEHEETYKVAGISYRSEALEALGKKNPNFAKSEQELLDASQTNASIWEYSFSPRKHRDVDLIPEPDNPKDPNAIKVIVDGQHIGYIPAESCMHVHDLLKADRIQQIECSIGGGRKKAFIKYGDRFVLESDFSPYSVRLTVTTK